jgi:hypothetical protein
MTSSLQIFALWLYQHSARTILPNQAPSDVEEVTRTQMAKDIRCFSRKLERKAITKQSSFNDKKYTKALLIRKNTQVRWRQETDKISAQDDQISYQFGMVLAENE